MKNDTTLSFLDEFTSTAKKSPIRGKEETKKKKDSHVAPQHVERDLIQRGYTFVDGLCYLEPYPLKSKGVCGPKNSCTYEYFTSENMGRFIKLLKDIAEQNAIFAIDFETGPAKKAVMDEKTGQYDQRTLSYAYQEGSNPHSSVVFLLAISIEARHSYVVDVREALQHPEFREALGRACIFGRPIAHNLAFEWMYVFALTGYRMICHSDPMVQSQVLYAGLPDPLERWTDPEKKPSRIRVNINAVLQRELGECLDKTEQTSFLSLHPLSGLTNAQIAYVAGDTSLLIPLSKILEDKMCKKGIFHIWQDIEAKFLPILAENSYFGCPVDLSAIIEFRAEAWSKAEVLKQQWDKLHPGISITSSQQVLEFFQKRYPNKEITQVDEVLLESLFRLGPDKKTLISGDKDAKLILDFREVNKAYSTYLEPWFSTHRHPITGNIHPHFWQAATATGRLSCNSPNFQNLTSNGYWKKIRHCIAAQEGFTLVDRDLSQFEVRALAEMAGEEKMMDFFHRAKEMEIKMTEYLESHTEILEEVKGLLKKPSAFVEEIVDYLGKSSDQIAGKYPELEGLAQSLQACDFHTLNARAIFGSQFTQATPDQRVELRKQAKVLTFAIPYGAGPSKIAETFKMSIKKAKELIDKYYKAWPNIARFLDQCKKDAIQKRFVASPTGRKRFFFIPENFPDTERRRLEGSAERQAANAPIQSINGDVLKVATILMAADLARLGARILLWVHDEILVHCPNEHIAEVSVLMDKHMKAAAIQCGLTRCPIKTSLEVGHAWSH